MSVCSVVAADMEALSPAYGLSEDTFPTVRPGLPVSTTLPKDYQEGKDGTTTVPLMCLDAASLGDIPARYIIPSVTESEFPAIGVYLDPRIQPGFKYCVRVLPDPTDDKSRSFYLFGGAALTLESIGRGYSRRLTFEPTADLNDNDNYFWTDSHPGGFSLEIQAISAGEDFRVLDERGVYIGDLSITRVLGKQDQVSQSVDEKGVWKKITANFGFKCFLLTQVTFSSQGVGVIEISKRKGGKRSEVISIDAVFTINGLLQRVSLVPTRNHHHSIRVNGGMFNDIPIEYSICGLEEGELPVIGSYVDCRIIAGFKYRVRSLATNKFLFNGQALLLLQIGRGYGKRITFASDDLNNNENFFWSDSCSHGFGFQIEPIEIGTHHKTLSHEGTIAEKIVFTRVFSRPKEIYQNKSVGETFLEKRFKVDVEIAIGNTSENRRRVVGLAAFAKTKNSKEAKLFSLLVLQEIESNVALGGIPGELFFLT